MTLCNRVQSSAKDIAPNAKYFTLVCDSAQVGSSMIIIVIKLKLFTLNFINRENRHINQHWYLTEVKNQEWENLKSITVEVIENLEFNMKLLMETLFLTKQKMDEKY